MYGLEWCSLTSKSTVYRYLRSNSLSECQTLTGITPTVVPLATLGWISIRSMLQFSEGTTYYLFFLLLHLSIVHGKKLEFIGFLSFQALYFVILYQVIWKGLIILTVILVIAAIEGMCIILLHWFAIRVQS